MIPSKEKLTEITKELQKILRVQDWDIDVDVCSQEEFEKNGYPDEQAHNTVVRLLNKSAIYINKDATDDWYKSLVHELMHLVFDPVEQSGIVATGVTSGRVSKCIDDIYMVNMERTVERVSQIFCSVYPVTNFIKEGD